MYRLSGNGHWREENSVVLIIIIFFVVVIVIIGIVIAACLPVLIAIRYFGCTLRVSRGGGRVRIIFVGGGCRRSRRTLKGITSCQSHNGPQPFSFAEVFKDGLMGIVLGHWILVLLLLLLVTIRDIGAHLFCPAKGRRRRPLSLHDQFGRPS